MRSLRDHFVPHEGNDYQPHLLQKTAMTLMLFMVLLSFALANLQATLWLNIDWMVSTILPAVIVAETNDERADESVGALRRSAVLDRAAQLKAEHMAEEGYFSHYSPSGVSPWHWFRVANYPFVHAGENLAVHFNDSREVVRAWMDSPTHRANIVNGNFTEIGIGVAEGRFEGYNTVFVVQLFGTPAAPVAAAPTSERVTVVTEQVTPTRQAEEAQATVASAEGSVVEDVILPPQSETVSFTDLIPVEVVPEASVVSEIGEVAATPTESTAPDVPIDQFSGTLTTSTDAVPATIGTTPSSETAPTLWRVFGYATSPTMLLQALYVVLGGVVLLTLLLSLVLEWRRRNLRHVAYSTGLVATMCLLWYLHVAVTTGATII
jgi:hypothetical protein